MSSTTSLTRQFDTVVTPAPTKICWRIFVLMLMLIAINDIDRASISDPHAGDFEGVRSRPQDGGIYP